MTMAASLRQQRGGVPRFVAVLALGLALLALLLLAVGPLGWRAGWWHYRLALGTLFPWGGYCGLAAAALALVAIGLGWRANSGRSIALGISALIVGGAVAYVPWHYDQMRGRFATVNDITTDIVNPPEFVSAVAVRKAAGANSTDYDRKFVEVQRGAYPDIAPVTLDMPPADAFARALAAAQRRDWTIVATDPAAGRIEALQRSRWFGFTDDIIVRVAPAGIGSRVDVRSSARMGRGDFGVNAARVRAYIKELREGS
jgi:uncharacterized protein (DUF1499 family)